MIDGSSIKSNLKIIDDYFIIALCSPVMEGTLALQGASEAVFIDSSGNMDRFNCRGFFCL